MWGTIAKTPIKCRKYKISYFIYYIINIMKLLFFDFNEKLIEAYKKIIRKTPFLIEFWVIDVESLIQKKKLDALVSPANSFGNMSGGIDSIYADLFPGIAK